MSINISTGKAWCLLVFGGVLECFWVGGLKYSTTFFEATLTGIAIIASFIIMLVVIKKIEVSIAYSVFVGIGAGGVVLSEILVFNEPFSMLKILFIVTLMIGVMGLKFASKEIDKDVEKFDKDSLDELMR